MIKTVSEHIQRFIDVIDGGLAVFSAYDQVQMSGDMAAPFLQEANFWWLTQVTEPGWKVIIDGARRNVVLVRPEIDEIHRIFDGESSDEALIAQSGAHEIILYKDFEKYLTRLSKVHSVVHTYVDKSDYGFVHNPAQRELHSVLSRMFASVQDCGGRLASLRARKDANEIAVMKQAAKLTCAAFAEVRNRLPQYVHEYEVEADFTQYFRKHNATHAYEPIVASGENAVTLHYTKNSDKLAKNRLVLIDIGARVNGYCADITRTYGIRPTKRQRAVHAAVEAAHHRIIELIQPNLAIAEYMHAVDEIMKDALCELNLLEARSDDTTYRRYFPHSVSHGLGVDVHDSLGKPQFLQPGMVLTVEPGIYIAEEGIGVRIEDDILVTETGHLNLTAGLSTSL